ncbi:hypothetical protein JGU66_12310 [Myxococcaceae bacterium JPH2]|nr:hypothetical protein [Myxococcaceae bacterium JPH2]
MNYYPWLNAEDSSFAWIMATPNVLANNPDEYLLYRGVSVKSWFPASPTFYLSKGRGMELTDSIPNAVNLCFTSARLKTFMEEHSGASLEFLPVRLLDQKERPVQEPYYLMNLLDTLDCVDLEKSKFERAVIDPSLIMTFFLLVLDESRIPEDKKLFRLKESPELIIIREDLAQGILDTDHNGMMFLEMHEYGKEWGGR